MAIVIGKVRGPTPPPPSPPEKPTSHLAVIVFENKEFNDIVGNPNAAYINSLISHGKLFTRYFAVSHPSLPNYMALTSAGAAGCTSDTCPADSNPNESLFHQMNTASAAVSWRVYAEDMPSNCHLHDSGTYVLRHNPAPYYRDIGPHGDNSCARFDVPFSRLRKDIRTESLPQFALIVPDRFHDMHDDAHLSPCILGSGPQNTICQGDSWLAEHLPSLLSDGGRQDVTAFVVFDEGETTRGGGGHIAVIEVGPNVCRGCQVTETMNHHKLLSAIEDWLHLPHLRP